MYTTRGPDDGILQPLSSTGNALPNTSPRSGDPSRSGSATVKLADDNSTNSQNIEYYANTDRNVPLGEYSADFAVNYHGQESRVTV
jgi:hypothetical protein